MTLRRKVSDIGLQPAPDFSRFHSGPHSPAFLVERRACFMDMDRDRYGVRRLAAIAARILFRRLVSLGERLDQGKSLQFDSFALHELHQSGAAGLSAGALSWLVAVRPSTPAFARGASSGELRSRSEHRGGSPRADSGSAASG